MVKNRIHALLDRYHVPAPAVSDMFGKRGRDYLAKVELPTGAQELLPRISRCLRRSRTRCAPPSNGCGTAYVVIIG